MLLITLSAGYAVKERANRPIISIELLVHPSESHRGIFAATTRNAQQCRFQIWPRRSAMQPMRRIRRAPVLP